MKCSDFIGGTGVSWNHTGVRVCRTILKRVPDGFMVKVCVGSVPRWGCVHILMNLGVIPCGYKAFRRHVIRCANRDGVHLNGIGFWSSLEVEG